MMAKAGEALRPFLTMAAQGIGLAHEDARAAFDVLMAGEATEAQTGGLLMAMRARAGGETLDEIVAAAEAMRARMLPVKAPPGALDAAGTGGDGKGSLNVSTLAALIAAAAGVPIAKHGNRASSSLCGSADVLEALGGAISLNPDAIAVCIREIGFGFMFAPNHHASMRHVGPTRAQLGTRTIFNLLGPLTCPAQVSRQLIGVYAPERMTDIARAAKALGIERAWVAHGSGYDEIAISGPTQVVEVRGAGVGQFTITPEEVGLARASEDALAGGDAKRNAQAIRAVLAGEGPPAFRDAGLINAAALLTIADKTPTLAEGVALAREVVASGAGAGLLEAWIARSQALAA